MARTGRSPWDCRVCGAGYNGRAVLLAHEATHPYSKWVQCLRCLSWGSRPTSTCARWRSDL